MNQRDQYLFSLQYRLGRLFIFIAAPVITMILRLLGYTVADLSAMRGRIASRIEKHDGPWLICANHLTMVDSILISYVMFPFHHYLVRYRHMPWNMPDKINLYRIHPILILLCYLLKCIPVVRGGNRDQLNTTLAKCTYLLTQGESLLIFPEGGRSRAGRIDPHHVHYGVGRFARLIPHCRVMCIYLRGEHQTSYSDLPCRNETFYVAFEDFKPLTQLKGLKAQRDVAYQIIAKLKTMEETYFALRGK